MQTEVKSPNLARLGLWADELINGSREQGDGNLRQGDKYCCLGVAIEVAMANGCEVEVEANEEGLYRYDHCADFLPTSVIEWYGLDGISNSHNPVVGTETHDDCSGDGGQDCINTLTATEANDEKKWTFPQIGESIKQHYGLV